MGKILFIRGGAVGDFILTMPAIQLVRDNLPDLEIDILGYPSIAELAVSAGIADRVRSIEHAAMARFFAPNAELDKDLCDYLASFDVVVSYLYDPDGFFEANLLRAGVETLFVGPYRMVEEEPFQPAALQLAKPLESLALYLENPAPVFSFAGNESSVKRFTDGPLIALHPGSGSPSKNWSFESWIEIVRHIHSLQPETEFLITSGEAEAEVIPEFLSMLTDTSVPFQHRGDSSLIELASVFSEIDFYLGHDSGISHLAASAGAEGLLLFGPTNPKVWAPPHQGMDQLVSATVSLSEITVSEVAKRLSNRTYSQGRIL